MIVHVRRFALAALLAGCNEPTSGEATASMTGASTVADTTTAEPTSTGSSGLPEPCPQGETRACYGGPADTEDVGLCRAGTQTCDALGEWGPCVGDVVPAPQICETSEDEACTGAPCRGGQAWLKLFRITPSGWPGSIEAAALAVAANGDIVATGTFQGGVTIDGQTFTAVSDADIWIARFDPDGSLQWFRRFGGPDGDLDGYIGAPWSAGNISFAPGGDLLVTSNCINTVDFGDGPLAGNDQDAVLLRLTPGGDVVWARRLVGLSGFNFHELPLLVAAAPDGRIWLAATLYGELVDFGGGPLKSAGWGDPVLAQLDADGTHLWSRRYGDPGHQNIRAIDLTPDGGLVIAGGLEGSLELDGTTLVSAGTSDAYVARLDSDAQWLWARRYGDNHEQNAEHVHVDESGAITLSGRFASSIDLGGGTMTTGKLEEEWFPGSYYWRIDTFVAGLSADGEHQWSTALQRDDASTWLWSFDRGPDGTLALAGSGQLPTFTGDLWGSGDGPWIGALEPDSGHRWLHALYSTDYVGPLAAAGPGGKVITMFSIHDVQIVDGIPLGEAGVGHLILAEYGP